MQSTSMAKKENKKNVEANQVVEPIADENQQFNFAQVLEQMLEQLKRMKHVNPQSLRNTLIYDLYPLLIETFRAVEWYIMDLNSRVVSLEAELAESEEILSPEFAAQIIEFIGVTVRVLGVIIDVEEVKKNDNLMADVRSLITAAPGLIGNIQEITASSDEEDEDEDEDADDEAKAEVFEPKIKVDSSVPAIKTNVIEEDLVKSDVESNDVADVEKNPEVKVFQDGNKELISESL